MKDDHVIIKKSFIQWKGVFASRDFKKWEKVLHRDISHTIPKDVFQKMTDKEKEYITFLNGKYTVMQSPEKYVNHSCEPNTTAKDFCDVAIKDIKKGEEITGNYLETEENTKINMKCTCKSKQCKKYILNRQKNQPACPVGR